MKKMKNKFISTSILFFTLCVPVMVFAQNTFPATGNVGIGTTTPQEKLDVNGNIRINGNTLYLRGTGDVNHGIAFRGQNPFASQSINGPVVFGWSDGALGTTINGEKIALRWNLDGNVGIGTNTLSEKLNVNGKIVVGSVDFLWMTISAGQISLNWAPVYGGRPKILTVDADLYAADTRFSRSTIGGTGIVTGDINADYKLAVNGKIVAKSIYVTMTGWGDFVFDKNYQRMNWLQKKNFFETNKHLPGLSTAAEIEQNGVNMSETLKHVTINVEENSLDIIDLYQRLEKLEAENMQLKKELKSFKGKTGK
jgi:hypothetical protein